MNLQNLRIGKKLYLGFGLVTLIMLSVIGFAYIQFVAESDAVAINVHTYEVIGEADAILTSLVNMETGERGFALTGKEEFLEPYNNGKSGFQQNYDRIKQLTSDNPKQQERLVNLLQQEKEWLANESDRLIELRRQVGTGQVKMEEVMAFVQAGKGKQSMDGMRKLLADIKAEESSLLAKRSEALHQGEMKTKITLVGGSAVGLVLAAFFAFLITRGITKPVNLLYGELTKLAQSGGDLRQEIHVDTKDEIGDLANAINQFLADLRGIMIQVLHSAENVSASTSELTTSAGQSAQASNQVAASITEVAQGADMQVKAVSEASAVIEQMSAGIQQMAANANAVSGMAEKTAKAATEGNKAVSNATTQMNSIEKSVSSSTQVVSKLGERSNEIGQIVATISGIAGQTNLLALNAAIEAARAGEQGKGFAVVAEEVRKLAEQSQEAAKQIADLISEIQAETSNAVSAMNEGSREVKIGTDVMNSAGKAFREIVSLIDQVSSQVSEISAATQQMASGSQQIVSSVREIDRFSKDAAAQTQTVSAATEEQSATIEQIASSSKELQKMAEDLKATVGKFKV
ncbi:methyl-accepting chemotaxis protein [Heliobacterium mobile]|uniref:methyl-accepting chemotaxis protein n=1 Tax=Heliobacterium mobile TaxID=28064 RepID=UPI001A9AB335|nr:methyl-accepting chemotaxis protein [Heliobacterium mobile]